MQNAAAIDPAETNSPPTHPTETDFLIAGGGLAGSLLAWNATQRGISYVVADPLPACNASLAAAGVLNPVTGKRLVKTWLVDQLLPAARSTYREIEASSGNTFFHDRSILRLIQSTDERRQWEKRMAQPDYASFLGEFVSPASVPGGWADPLGSFLIRQVGNLEVPLLLSHLHEQFEASGTLVRSRVCPSDLEISPTSVRWGKLRARRVVFCEGYRGASNPWFGHLPFNPAKGEVIALQGLDLPSEFIVHKQKWVLPLSGQRLLVGSTWGWNPEHDLPTPQGRTAVYHGLCEMLPPAAGLPITDHQAAIRPCTRDRHPFLGIHPLHPNLSIFNGFGSKGVLLIPLLANLFLDHLLSGVPLHPEIDISRFFA